MDGGLELCTEGSNQNYPKRRSARKQWLPEDVLNQLRKEEKQKVKEKAKIYPIECRLPEQQDKKDKKAFLSEQYKKVEENNRMGNKSYLKKIGDIKEHFMQGWAQ